MRQVYYAIKTFYSSPKDVRLQNLDKNASTVTYNTGGTEMAKTST